LKSNRPKFVARLGRATLQKPSRTLPSSTTSTNPPDRHPNRCQAAGGRELQLLPAFLAGGAQVAAIVHECSFRANSPLIESPIFLFEILIGEPRSYESPATRFQRFAKPLNASSSHTSKPSTCKSPRPSPDHPNRTLGSPQPLASSNGLVGHRPSVGHPRRAAAFCPHPNIQKQGRGNDFCANNSNNSSLAWAAFTAR